MRTGSLDIYANGGSALKLYKDSGIIDSPKQSGCRVYQLSSSQSVASGAEVKIVLDAENYDSQNEFDSTTNYRFTSTKAGKYLVIASICWTDFNDGGYCYIEFRKNGTSKSYNDIRTGASGTLLLKHIDEINMLVGDYLEFYVYNGDSVSRNLHNADTHTYIIVKKVG